MVTPFETILPSVEFDPELIETLFKRFAGAPRLGLAELM
jgi:hypothetical protein